MRQPGVRHMPPGRRLAGLLIWLLAMAIVGPLAAVAIGRGAGAHLRGAPTSSSPSGGSGLGPGTGTQTASTPSTTTPATTTQPATATQPAAPTGTTTTPATPTATTPGTAPTTPATGTATATTPDTTTPATTTSTTPATGGNPGSPYTTPTATLPPLIAAGPAGNPLANRGMWVWVVSATDGGSLPRIITQARSYGITTLMVKSSDGPQMWSQFNPLLVSTLHAAGLHVCAWQFVYGDHPVQEARVGAQAVRDGADCLLIDAESQYEGKYVQAQTYIVTLRELIGSRFPVALAGFPYIDYHPAFPYSVFLGPGGAQVNTPQMYWKDIGTSVTAVYSHTYEFNRLYERPIDPLGQVFDSPPATQIHQFRSLSRSYRAQGVSWWDWQSARVPQFRAIASPAPTLQTLQPDPTVISLRRKALGDVVVWAQEHLVSAGQPVTIDGEFGAQMQQAVRQFQTQHFLPVTGVIDAATWGALLHYPPAAVTWTSHRGKLAATPGAPSSLNSSSNTVSGFGTVLGSGSISGTTMRIALRSHAPTGVISETLPVPRSARLRSGRDELHGTPGAG